MSYSFPFAQPAGFRPWSYITILNYLDLQNPSARGKSPLGTGAVLFKFSKFSHNVRITIDLLKTGGIGILDSVDLDVPAKDRDRFVLFEGFPSNYTSKNAYCDYELWLLNTTPNQQDRSASVEVVVMYRG